MAEQPMGAQGNKTMELTPAEQQAVERMRMTPAERAAEQQARKQARLAAMTPEVRQVIEERNARVDAMDPTQRRAFLAGRRLAGTARSLKLEVQKGLSFDEAMASLEQAETEAVDWLRGKLAEAGA